MSLTPEVRSKIFQTVEKEVANLGLDIESKDTERPWGGFFVIAIESLNAFLAKFFPEVKQDPNLPLSPKILVVLKGELLSWQWHERRSEQWRVVQGVLGFYASQADQLPALSQSKPEGELIIIPQGMRHTATSLSHDSDYTVVAEIWEHRDPTNPSNEDDIHRISDKYGRKTPQ